MSLKTFFFGLGAGIALTLLTLEMWGRHLDRRTLLNANPWLLQPLRQRPAPQIPESSDKLPRPFLPAVTCATRDHWTIRPLGGKAVTLDEFKGKVVFLNFWNASCPPCLAELPGIEKLQKSLRGAPIAFLAVAQEDEQTVRSLLRKAPLRLPVYLADNETPEEFGPPAVPRTFILDRSGHEVFRAVGGLNWDDEQARKYLRGLGAR